VLLSRKLALVGEFVFVALLLLLDELLRRSQVLLGGLGRFIVAVGAGAVFAALSFFPLLAFLVLAPGAALALVVLVVLRERLEHCAVGGQRGAMGMFSSSQQAGDMTQAVAHDERYSHTDCPRAA
jgi:hypothetical protein